MAKWKKPCSDPLLGFSRVSANELRQRKWRRLLGLLIKDGIAAAFCAMGTAGGYVARHAAGETGFSFTGWMSRLPTMFAIFGGIWLCLAIGRYFSMNRPSDLVCSHCGRTQRGDRVLSCPCGGLLEDVDWFDRTNDASAAERSDTQYGHD